VNQFLLNLKTLPENEVSLYLACSVIKIFPRDMVKIHYIKINKLFLKIYCPPAKRKNGISIPTIIELSQTQMKLS